MISLPSVFLKGLLGKAVTMLFSRPGHLLPFCRFGLTPPYAGKATRVEIRTLSQDQLRRTLIVFERLYKVSSIIYIYKSYNQLQK